MQRLLSPGCVVVHPNREKPESKSTKGVVTLLLLVSALLMLIITVGGWSKLEGLRVVGIIWAAVYIVHAYFVSVHWNRAVLVFSAAFGIGLLAVAVIAGTGLSGTVWFDRNAAGFSAPHTLFGGSGLAPDLLGLLTLILAPLQVLLIVASMVALSQGWNVETEAPIEEARRRGYRVPPTPPGTRTAQA